MCNVRDPNLVTFYLCIYLILNEEHFTFHLQYKHSGTFANRKYEEMSYPKNQKMCEPILVILLKMRLHYSQSSPENATPSSGTPPLASGGTMLDVCERLVPVLCHCCSYYIPGSFSCRHEKLCGIVRT